MTTTTTRRTASAQHDGLVRGLCLAYLILAALYIPSAWMILSMQRDAFKAFETTASSVGKGASTAGMFAEMEDVFTVMAIATGTFGAVLVVLPILMAARRGYAICFALAVLLAIFFPLGTVLGGLTIYALLRPDIQAQFGCSAQ